MLWRELGVVLPQSELNWEGTTMAHMYQDRICEICRTAVEDEKHILLNCVYYNDLHIKLFKDASTIDEHFSEMSEDDKFIFLMSNPNVCIFTAKTCKKILDRRKFYFRNF